MSVVSSVLSSRSSAWKINPRVASFMDSIFAIAFGLGLRLVVDAVSHHDFKLTGTIVGLWEGIILLHFLKKMPRSTDPYVAYGVRLFVDFLCTESVARLVLVLIWTGMGMVLADITPALWDDVGLNRIWRRFRRDLYTISRMIPTVAFFPPPRTVRFSPSREHSIIPEEPSILDSQPPSVVATEQTNTTPITIPATTMSPAPAAQEILKRRVPGYFPGDYSDTDTDLGSPRARSPRAGPSTGRTSRRLSVYPQQLDYDESVTDLSSNNDLDEGNLSSDGSSVSTERAGPSSITFDTAVIPDMEVEEELVDISASVSNVEIPVKDEENITPRQAPMYLPPTPSDSAVRWGRPSLEPENEPLPTRPLSSLPQIPDFLEEPTTEDLEKMQPKEAEPEPAAEEQQKPPTPPAKDDLPPRFAIPIPPVPTMPPPEPVVDSMPEPDEEWEILKSEFIVSDTSVTTTHDDHHHDQRQSLPPSYREHDEFDDIYGDEYVEPTLNDLNDMGPSMRGGGDLGAQESLIDDSIVSPLGPPFNFTFGQAASLNPWSRGATSAVVDELAEFTRRQEEDGERQKKKLEDDAKAEADAAEKLREAEEKAAAIAAAKKAAEGAAERERLAEEEAKRARLAVEERERKEAEEKKKEEEKAERKRKEAADELVRQQKRMEEEAEKKRLAEEEEAARKAEKKRRREAKAAKKAEEEAEAARIAADEAKKREEEADMRRKDAEEAATREKARIAKEEKDKQEQEAREADEKKKVQEEEERKQKEADDLKAKEDAIAAAAVATALELEKQEAKKTAEEATKTIESQPEGAQTQEAPAPTTIGEEAANTTATPTTKDLPQAPGADPADANVQTTSGGDKTPVPRPAELPPTTESDPANAPTNGGADDTITPETQDGVNLLGESPAHDDDGAESVATEASEMPSVVGERVHKLILAKAQMVNVRDRIEELKQKLGDPNQDQAFISEQLKVSEKVLKKMENKEQRRYTDGVAAHGYLQPDADEGDSMILGNMGPSEAGIMIQEKLEELMRPGMEDLHLTINTGPKNKNGPKQKTRMAQIMKDYGLLTFCREDATNGRFTRLNLTEAEFRQWLLNYRQAATAPPKDDDDPWN
ncbi:hypothetical protein BDN70DRAFT_451300 [Pholiota conissans]|uniref:Uncharacterized protein n=1 Tax=Pholiota conissans TaxID=109636 RepID=A0A9P5ZA49_9AGAR|nr:hypothetical protein BDN70DRAFT_451300 [Pholiota conissans]